MRATILFATSWLIISSFVQSNSARPNILILLADDLGYGEISAMRQGYKGLNHNITTPNIDTLMASGVRFTNFYSNTECSVSRGAFMTGKHTGHATIRGNRGPGLGAQDTTFLKTLLESDYRSTCIGKWHMAGFGEGFAQNPAGAPWNQGCERYFGPENPGWYFPTDHIWRYTLEDGLQEQMFPVNANASRERCMAEGNDCVWLSDLNLDAALAELDYHHKRQMRERATGMEPAPFIIYAAFSDPHSGFWSKADSDLKGNPVPRNGRFGLEETWPNVEQDHAAAITLFHDVFVQKILDKLSELELRETTAVVYVSDNGAADEASIGGHSGAFFQSAGPLAGFKLSLSDGGIRVPAAVSWPGYVAANATSDAVQAIWDLAPTILDIAGVPEAAWPAGMDGVSLWKSVWQQPRFAVTGKVWPSANFTHPPLYWERCSTSSDNRPSWSATRVGNGFSRAVRDGPWKGLQLFKDGNFSELRLFDMRSDVGESIDVAAMYPYVAARLQRLLDSPEIRTSDVRGYGFPVEDDCLESYGELLV